jgi:SAM-dependent methyltransferase
VSRFAAALVAALPLFAPAQEGEQRPPFVTTPSDVVMRMLRLAGAGPGDLVADLGSGDGRIVIAAARELGARGLGIELDPALVEKSRENAQAAGVADRVKFVQGDVLLADISQASVVTVYLLPQLMQKLQPRLLDELQPGSRIVSHAFAMSGWKPDRYESLRVEASHPGQGDVSTVFLWIVPAKARGAWRSEDGWQLRVRQNFQEVEVEAALDGRAVPVSAARLAGRELRWRATGASFSGRIEGERILGELVSGGKASPLVFTRAR